MSFINLEKAVIKAWIRNHSCCLRHVITNPRQLQWKFNETVFEVMA